MLQRATHARHTNAQTRASRQRIVYGGKAADQMATHGYRAQLSCKAAGMEENQ